MARPELTFVPSDLVPAGGSFALWSPVAPLDGLASALADLDLPEGEPAELADRRDRRRRPAAGRASRPPRPGAARRPTAGGDAAGQRLAGLVAALGVGARLVRRRQARARTGRRRPDPADVPARATTPGTGRAHWRVAAAGDDRVAELAAALPVAAHALRRPSGELWTAEDLLARLPRRGRRRLRPRGSSSGARPASSRTPPPVGRDVGRRADRRDPTVAHLRVASDDLAAEVEDWAAPLLGRDRAAVARLAVRLEPPEIGDDGRDDVPARLAGDRRARGGCIYLLQSTLDPGRVGHRRRGVGRRGAWARPRRPPPADDPEATLVRGLAAAARLFAPIDRSLSESRPVGLDLTAGEVADAAQPAGRGRARRRRHRRPGPAGAARRGRTAPAAARPDRPQHRPAPRVEGAAPLGLSSITDLRYEVALGDDTLSAEEFAEIVALKQPLVRWRGNWIRVDHDEVDRLAELAGSDRVPRADRGAGRRAVGPALRRRPRLGRRRRRRRPRATCSSDCAGPTRPTRPASSTSWASCATTSSAAWRGCSG